MGVKSCGRKGCSNIMCDLYIPWLGYICNDCKREFEQRFPSFPTKGQLCDQLRVFYQLSERTEDPVSTTEYLKQYEN
jgi:hypothetical protein